MIKITGFAIEHGRQAMSSATAPLDLFPIESLIFLFSHNLTLIRDQKIGAYGHIEINLVHGHLVRDRIHMKSTETEKYR